MISPPGLESFTIYWCVVVTVLSPSTPAEMGCRIGQTSASHATFTLRLRARPSDLVIFEATFVFTVVTAR